MLFDLIHAHPRHKAAMSYPDRARTISAPLVTQGSWQFRALVVPET
jgi:hypothetical protein